MQEQNTTPISILTGYLGAGKTTLLNRILHAEHGVRVAVLVNDFGKINIDSKLITGVSTDLVVLVNGCICCTIRDSLVATIHQLVNRNAPPDYIIIEASGVSNPAQIIVALNRSGIRNHVHIDSIITITDSEQFGDVVGKPKKLLQEQIKTADTVILNKVDLVTNRELEQMRHVVKSLAPDANIFEASYCDVPLKQILGTKLYNPQRAFELSQARTHVHHLDEMNDHEHSDHSLVFGTWDWHHNEPLSYAALRDTLNQLPTTVFRAKGVLYLDDMPDKRIELQLVGKHITLTESGTWGDETPHTEIVLIGMLKTWDDSLLVDRFKAMLASDAPPKPLPMVNGKLTWQRENMTQKAD